jgi:hypothetical protein
MANTLTQTANSAPVAPPSKTEGVLNDGPYAKGLRYEPEKTSYTAAASYDSSGCRPQDRIDRNGALAWIFGKEKRSRVALHMSFDGPDFSEPLPALEEVSLRYTLKFQKHKKKKERCLFPSARQGLIGSIYNELYQREGTNAFDEAIDLGLKELESRGLDFWR